MTAPSSPVALLDQLDELRAKATPGPWEVDEDWIWAGLSGGGAFGELVSKAVDIEDADAALIVAAVNALDGLVAVVREMWDEHDGRTCCDRTGPSFNGVELCDTRQMIADSITAK